MCMSGCSCVFLSTIWVIATHTFSEFQKHPRSAQITQTSQQQRYHKQQSSHTYEEAHLFPPYLLPTPPGFHVNQIPTGTFGFYKTSMLNQIMLLVARPLWQMEFYSKVVYASCLLYLDRAHYCSTYHCVRGLANVCRQSAV